MHDFIYTSLPPTKSSVSCCVALGKPLYNYLVLASLLRVEVREIKQIGYDVA